MVVRIIFSSILQIWYVEVRISQSISESPLELEITRIDCMFSWRSKTNMGTFWMKKPSYLELRYCLVKYSSNTDVLRHKDLHHYSITVKNRAYIIHLRVLLLCANEVSLPRTLLFSLFSVRFIKINQYFNTCDNFSQTFWVSALKQSEMLWGFCTWSLFCSGNNKSGTHLAQTFFRLSLSFNTVFTISIQTPQLLSILVLKFD